MSPTPARPEFDELMAAAAAAAPVGILAIDRTGRILFANAYTETLFGFAPHELADQPVEVLLPEHARTAHVQTRSRYMAAPEARQMGARQQLFGRRKDGSPVAIEVGLNPMPTDEGTVVIATLLDVSARWAAQQDAAESQEIYRKLFTSLRDAAGVIQDEHFVLWNERLLAITGRTQEQLTAGLFTDFVMPEFVEALGQRYANRMTSGQEPPSLSEVQVRMPDGSSGPWVEINAQRIAYRGRPAAMVLLRDITERKEQAAQLEAMVQDRTRELVAAREQAEEASQAKSQLLTNMSHELRTPMHAILSFAELGVANLARKSDADPKLAKYFDRILTSARRLLRLLNDLLDLSKLSAGKMEFKMAEANIHRIAAEVVAEFDALARSKDIELGLKDSPDFCEAWCDAERIRQVLRNLVSNSLKFTPAGGRVDVRLTESESGPGTISLTVQDTGVGIPEKELESIFEQFSQSSRTDSGSGGTGLGLAICREIVGRHRGTIVAKNNKDGGASMSVTIPVKAS